MDSREGGLTRDQTGRLVVVIPIQATGVEGDTDSLHIGPESVLGVSLVLHNAHRAVGLLEHVSALDVITIPHLPGGLVVSRLGILHTILVLVVWNVLQWEEELGEPWKVSGGLFYLQDP